MASVSADFCATLSPIQQVLSADIEVTFHFGLGEQTIYKKSIKNLVTYTLYSWVFFRRLGDYKKKL